MDLIGFISTLLNFLLKCLSNIQSLLVFVFDFPSYVLETINTFPSYFIIGFECILTFIAISVCLKLYRDLH